MAGASTTLRLVLLGDAQGAVRAMKDVGTETDKTSKKQQALHKVGHAAGIALAGGLALAAAGAVKATKAAADDQLSTAKMAQTYHKAAGATDAQIASTESWITAQGKAKGVADDDLRPALSRLVVATHSVSKAQRLAGLAMDVSAGTGKSLSSVSAALAKAQNGNVSGLSRLGVATKDATGKTLSLHQITRQLSDTYSGAAAKSAQTAAGKQKILTVQMHELQEKIGYGLLPVMSKLVAIGIKVIDWVSRNTKLVGIIVGVLGTLAAVTWAVSAATKAWAAISKVFAAAQWLVNAALDANPIGLVVIAIAALVAGLIIAYKHSETFRRIVNAAFHAVWNAAKTAFTWIKDHWRLLLAIITGPIGAAVIYVVTHWTKIRTAAVALWTALKNGFAAAWNWIRDKTTAFVTFVTGIPGKIGRVLSNMWQGAKDAWNTFGAWERAKIGDLIGFIGGIGGKISRAAAGMFDGIKSAFRSAIDWVIVAWNGLSFSVPSIHVFGHTIGGFTLNTPNIPLLAMAKGGIVTSPTVALIGEAGPEAVIPLGRGGSGGNLGTVTLVLKDRSGREIQRELLELKRTNGGLALGLA